MPWNKVTTPKTQLWPEASIGTSLFFPFCSCDLWLSVSPQFTSDSTTVTGPKIRTCLGLYHWKGLRMTLHFLPTFLVTAVKHLASKAVMGFFPNFDLPLHQICFYWHRLHLSEQFQFTPVVLNRGWPAIKSNPDETLHLCCLEGVWGAWTGFSEAAAGLSCPGWGLEVMGRNLNQEPDPPATLQRLQMIVCRGTQGKWGKHSLPSCYFRLEWREIY